MIFDHNQIFVDQSTQGFNEHDLKDTIYNQQPIQQEQEEEQLNFDSFTTRGPFDSSSSSTNFPWFASILRLMPNGNKQFVCGGTLLNSNSIITAASCFYGFENDDFVDPTKYIIELGKFNRATHSEDFNTLSFIPKDIIIHPEYSPYKSEHDNLAIAVLPEHLEFSEYIQPINIAQDDQPIENTYGSVSIINLIFNI